MISGVQPPLSGHPVRQFEPHRIAFAVKLLEAPDECLHSAAAAAGTLAPFRQFFSQIPRLHVWLAGWLARWLTRLHSYSRTH